MPVFLPLPLIPMPRPSRSAHRPELYVSPFTLRLPRYAAASRVPVRLLTLFAPLGYSARASPNTPRKICGRRD